MAGPHDIEYNRMKGAFKFENENAWTYLKVQLISFSHICIGKCKNVIIFQLQNKSPSPANEFLVHTVGSIGKLEKK